MFLMRLYRSVYRRVRKGIIDNRYFNWYVFSRHLSEKMMEEVEQSYSHSPVKRTVVFICNGNINSGGLADRLKGILSTYEVCKELNYDFKIHFTYPFDLSMFLTCNSYDWSIDKDQVCFSIPQTEIVAFEIGQESDYQKNKQKQYLTEKLQSAKSSQVHVYCNAAFCYDYSPKSLFNELFRTSARLSDSIKIQRELLGEHYVSISVRFINSLGDFEDAMKYSPLPEDKKSLLMGNCINVLSVIRNKHPEMKLLVNSDSVTFLNRAAQVEGTFVIPGQVIHLDFSGDDNSDCYNQYEKTFLDFFMISEADIIYRIDGRWVHPTRFPYLASKISDKPFVSINYDKCPGCSI